ncbi:hypothetical protein [Aminobacter ciceronei]|uniref:MPP superfamily phosphohydrolase n=1 Tax=Aminobacter ciceronei TaxID=150723 RepID=A0ABR6C9N5_9HYPH|nr:hypothetical protein [Aminobacter ciceronei]MBA8907964.1 putative MPP superfamily phosphohydrolase [Aminobacter ciceronei]MBA9021719.1 putative MPP superfamily phosphohydrolase [Aminobacter ciceronei]
MLYALSNLDEGNLRAIQGLEKDLGLSVIAVTGVEVEAPVLEEEKLQKVQQLEKELGVVLVAVKQH